MRLERGRGPAATHKAPKGRARRQWRRVLPDVAARARPITALHPIRSRGRLPASMHDGARAMARVSSGVFGVQCGQCYAWIACGPWARWRWRGRANRCRTLRRLGPVLP
eukprot:5414646-Prymnesium_polylepis.1